MRLASKGLVMLWIDRGTMYKVFLERLPLLIPTPPSPFFLFRNAENSTDVHYFLYYLR